MLETTMINKAKAALAFRDTDQAVAQACSSLSPEDIHTMRHSEMDLDLLPFRAIQELSQFYDAKIQEEYFCSPLQEKEFSLFQARLKEELHQFKQYQEKQEATQSHMDTPFFQQLAQKLEAQILEDSVTLLTYFEEYQALFNDFH